MRARPLPLGGTALALLLVLPVAAQAPAAPPAPPLMADRLVDPGFEEGDLDGAPAGWRVPEAAAGWVARSVVEAPESGARCGLLARDDAFTGRPAATGLLVQSLAPGPLRGKRVRLRAMVRAAPGAVAQLVLQVDRPHGVLGFYDDMQDRPLTSPRWRRAEIVADVARDAERLHLGLMVPAGDRAWIDSVALASIGLAGDEAEPPRPLSDRGLANLGAFARLLGYVLWFHPSDGSVALDRESFALAGVQAAEWAPDAAALARTLEGLLRPAAPAVRVLPGARDDAGRRPGPAADAARRVLAFQWTGHAWAAGNRRYARRLVEPPGGADPEPPREPRPELPWCEPPLVVPLGGGVVAHLPLALEAGDAGTLPEVPANLRPLEPVKPSRFTPSGFDRATRLAAVALAWSALQHFYPFFEENERDWQAALESALRSAATDPDERAFFATLERLVAGLADGQAQVAGPGARGTYRLPLDWAWMGERLVVTHVPDPNEAGGLAAGDVIVRLDGRPTAEAVEAEAALVSASTRQWHRARTVERLLHGDAGEQVWIEVQPWRGEPFARALQRTVSPALAERYQEPRPEEIAEVPESPEVAEGVLYVDLCRIDDFDFRGALDRLAEASGLVFDLRCARPTVSMRILQHLADVPFATPPQLLPVVTFPDRRRPFFRQSTPITLPPAQPRLTGRTAFLADARTLGEAEAYLLIVERHRLGEIVGAPTAGSSGGTVRLQLLAGYELAWTGEKVLRHDGSPHQGTGIEPTIPAGRSRPGVARGADEVLEAGVRAVTRPLRIAPR